VLKVRVDRRLESLPQVVAVHDHRPGRDQVRVVVYDVMHRSQIPLVLCHFLII